MPRRPRVLPHRARLRILKRGAGAGAIPLSRDPRLDLSHLASPFASEKGEATKKVARTSTPLDQLPLAPRRPVSALRAEKTEIHLNGEMPRRERASAFCLSPDYAHPRRVLLSFASSLPFAPPPPRPVPDRLLRQPG